MAGKTFLAFPAHAQPTILLIWQEAHYLNQCWPDSLMHICSTRGRWWRWFKEQWIYISDSYDHSKAATQQGPFIFSGKQALQRSQGINSNCVHFAGTVPGFTEKCLIYCKYHQTSNIRHLNRQLNCWSLTCGWSIACRRCSNYIFILDVTPGFNGSGKDSCKMRRETSKFWDLLCLILTDLMVHVHLQHFTITAIMWKLISLEWKNRSVYV